jgi:hypothetical protein
MNVPRVMPAASQINWRLASHTTITSLVADWSFSS